MKTGANILIRFCVVAALLFSLQAAAQPLVDEQPGNTYTAASGAGVFIENGGQVYDGSGNFRSDVDFLTTSGGMTIYFTDHGIVYHFYKIEPSKYDLIRSKKMENPYTPQEWEQINKDISEGKMNMDLVETRGKQYRIDIEFPGADLSRPSGEKQNAAKRNYFHPNYNDGLYGVSAFDQIRYTDVYPGIDLLFYYRDGTLKYDFELSAGADPSQIRVLYKGHQEIAIDADGNAVISILPGEITEQSPVAFQDGKPVAANFVLSGDTLLFKIADYNSELPLTIDPALRWSTYFYDNTTSGAFTYSRPQWDTNGNMFVLMDTYATAFPTVNPGGTAYYDFSPGDNGLQIIIMKFDPFRNLVWATYYCSSQSLSTNFNNQGLVIDQNNEIYCVGHMFFVYGTPAAAFPTLIPGGAYSETTPGNNRNCILKFANDGTRIWSTVFCTSGASSSGLDISGLAIDGSNRLLMVGDSYTPPSWTAMPLVNPGGATYYNGAPTESACPTLHRFTTALALQYSTYVSRGIASQYFNYGSCIALDASDNIFMGNSGTGNITTVNPGGAYIDGTGSSARKIILYKFLSTGALSWCTLYGGSTSANGIIWQDVRDVKVASNGDVIFVGRVNTTNFPTYDAGSGAFYKSTLSVGGTSVCDGVILKFSNGGVRRWATYIGGDGTSDGTDLMGLGIDASNNIYMSGICRSTSFPTQTLAGSYNQSTMTGSYAIIINMFNSSGVRQWGTYFGTGTWMSSGGFGVNNWVCGGVKVMQFGTSPAATPITTLDPGNGAYFQSTIEGTTCDFFAEFFYGTETTANATINAVAPICINTTAFNLSAATAGGTWSGTGITNAANGTFNPATAGVGTHTITYTIAGICGDTDTETITVNAVPTVNASATIPTICNGSSTTISASGGTTYNWSNSLGTNSSYSVSPSSTTTYTVTGSTSGCTNTATVTVNVTALPSVAASATIGTICNGQSTTISATGATSYSWSNSLGTNSAYSVNPATTTTYTVTGTTGSCSNTSTVTVTVNAVPTINASATIPTICNGSSTTISATGGTTYSWSNSLGTNSSYSVSPGSTTTYTVTGTSSGCSNVATVTVTVNAVPTINASATIPTICNGSSTTISATGGTTYSWSNSLGTNSSYAVSPGSTTTYTVTGTSSGCSSVATVTVNVTTLPNISASVSDAIICNGESTTISASGGTGYNWSGLGTNSSYNVNPSSTTTYSVTGTASGCSNTATVLVTVNAQPSVNATATYPSLCVGESTDIVASGGVNYLWDNALGAGSTHTVTPGATTTYHVTGTDANGCTNTALVTVTITTAPAVTAIAGTTSLCLGSSTTLNGGGAVNYTWNQGLGAGGSFIISPTSTTTYQVTGSSATGCSATANVTVTVNPVPADPIAAGTPSQICLGESTTITASGSGSVDYEVYTSPTGGTYLGDASLIVSPTATTVYYVQAVNAFGCANSGGRVPVTIIVNPLPVQPSVSASDTTICAGQSVALLAGGSGSGVVYEVWTAISGGTNLGYAPMMVSPSTTTTYYIQAVTAAGCSPSGGRVGFTFTVNPVTDAAMNPAGPFCIADAAAALSAINAGGTWAGTGITNASTGMFDPATAGAGTYEITYTTSGVCPDTDTMDVVVTNLLDATITPVGPFCFSDAAMNLSAATAGGLWSGTGITNTTSGMFDPGTAGIGTHEIVYSTSGSCADSDTIYITVANQMNASISAVGPFCETEAGLLLTAADAGGTWSGTGILNVASGLFDPATAGPGTHQINYTIPGACGDEDSIDIVIFDSPSFTYEATDESCTGAEDGTIVLSVTGGTNPLSYAWNTGATTAALSAIGEGNYLVTVTDANGCERNAAILLGDPGVACDDIHPHAVVPNAFSPNGDGENDVLYVRGEGVSQLSFIIYDRWGEKVFSTTSLDFGWDGTFRGAELDPAVFTYYLHAIFIDGSDKIEKGDITLTR